MMFFLVAWLSRRTVISPASNPGCVVSHLAVSSASLTHPFSQLPVGRLANSLIPTQSALAVMPASHTRMVQRISSSSSMLLIERACSVIR